MNLMDYVKRNQSPFEDLPFCAVDALAFAWFTYGDYAPLTSKLPLELSALSDMPYYAGIGAFEESFQPKRSILFVRLLSASKRFSHAKIIAYQSVKDDEKAVQFSAIAFKVAGRILIAYEGTDPSYAGWKEDFMMSYDDEIASYPLALSFYYELEKKYPNKPIVICGHSKGGNIASYVLAKVKDDSHIEAAYSFEGPGFHEKDIWKGKTKRLAKHHKFVPQGCLVGIAFGDEHRMNIIKSRSFGVLQHNPFNWDIVGSDFVYLKKRNLTSRYVDRAFNSWLGSLSDEEKKRFSEILFRALGNMDVVNFTRFFKDIFHQIGPLFHQYRLLSKEDKKFFQFVIGRLGKSAWKSIYSKQEEPKPLPNSKAEAH